MSVMSRIAREWAERCFGKDHVMNFAIRALRTLEESAELSQSLGVSRELAHKAIDTVYDRPVGEVEQEMGGVLHTMNILCDAMGVEPDEIAERELRRCLKKSPEHFAKRNQEKLDLGLDVTAQSLGDLDSFAAKLYQHYADNHPTIHSNRFPSWSDMGNGDRDIWRQKAREAPSPLPANQPQTGDDKARKAYEHQCDSGPIRNNRLPTWNGLDETTRNAWRVAVGPQDGPIPASPCTYGFPCPTPLTCERYGCLDTSPRNRPGKDDSFLRADGRDAPR